MTQATQKVGNDRAIGRVDVWCYRVPVSNRVVTSFGSMTSRPAVFVRLEDTDGAFGWGEIFANWPAAGAEHRARLLVEDISDLILGRVFAESTDLFGQIMQETRTRALQCGEWGPFAHVISGLDIAFNDLLARRAGQPLAKFLNSNARSSVPTYASGIHVSNTARVIDEIRSLGFDAFKVKVGFDMQSDIEGVKGVCGTLDENERLFTDANQGWTADEAITFFAGIKGQPVGWLEEPIPADAPYANWRRVAAASAIPLAGGENIVGLEYFDTAVTSGAFGVIQPDVAKWGGVSHCRMVALKATAKGRLYCPHFLGGGIGLAASAAVLASIDGNGLLEVDINENPLRGAFGLWDTEQGRNCFQINTKPGLGIVDLPEEIGQFLTLSATTTRAGHSTIAVDS